MIDFGSNLIVIVTKFVGHFKARNKIEILGKNYLRFLSENYQKVPIFVEKVEKIQLPYMTSRSQIEPSIKSYECFMILRNVKLETDGFLRDSINFFFQKPRKSKSAL